MTISKRVFKKSRKVTKRSSRSRRVAKRSSRSRRVAKRSSRSRRVSKRSSRSRRVAKRSSRSRRVAKRSSRSRRVAKRSRKVTKRSRRVTKKSSRSRRVTKRSSRSRRIKMSNKDKDKDKYNLKKKIAKFFKKKENKKDLTNKDDVQKLISEKFTSSMIHQQEEPDKISEEALKKQKEEEEKVAKFNKEKYKKQKQKIEKTYTNRVNMFLFLLLAAGTAVTGYTKLSKELTKPLDFTSNSKECAINPFTNKCFKPEIDETEEKLIDKIVENQVNELISSDCREIKMSPEELARRIENLDYSSPYDGKKQQLTSQAVRQLRRAVHPDKIKNGPDEKTNKRIELLRLKTSQMVNEKLKLCGRR